ncbi:MAG: hypothetical protein KF819_05760 [Labilithrix sp.]|nr:hypothetical protein [Labilithrix sp.]
MRASLAAIAHVVLAGCVLVVTPDEYGSTCHFAGEDSRCGSCLKQRCQAFIDDCCRDEACTSTLERVERCTTGDVKECALLGAESEAAEPSRSKLARCAESQCKAECAGGLTKSVTRCTVPTFGQGGTCNCVLSSTPNETLCSEATFPGTVCCAPEGWPAQGLRCSCKVITCGPSRDGCSCMLTDGVQEGPSCTGRTCCLLGDTCACGTNTCLPEEKMVASCSRDVIECPPGQKRVTSCSAGD